MEMKTILYVAGLIVLVLFFASTGCTDEDGSRRALESYGFTDIQFTGYEWWGCGEEDSFHTGFRAKNPQGRPVEGMVCCGLTKNCTVRW